MGQGKETHRLQRLSVIGKIGNRRIVGSIFVSMGNPRSSGIAMQIVIGFLQVNDAYSTYTRSVY